MTDANSTTINLDSLVGEGASEWTLDPSASSVEFHVKHFWGIMTVHGHFDTVTGDGKVAGDGVEVPVDRHDAPEVLHVELDTRSGWVKCPLTGTLSDERVEVDGGGVGISHGRGSLSFADRLLSA